MYTKKELIGKGHFTKVYKAGNSNGKKVMVYSTCPVKEVLALGWMPRTRRLPTLEVAYDNEGKEYYIAEKLSIGSKVKGGLSKALSAKEYTLYKELKAFEQALSKESLKTSDSKESYFIAMDVLKTFTFSNRSIKNILIESFDALSNYGTDVCFEISPRNVAISKAGKLILNDCFYLKSYMRF